ncbi:MAG: extracellular solute-binding protein [Anaerolineaceae bacterium]|nr:extracellular solute-binding protein [Anaerolineaceae bacterium]
MKNKSFNRRDFLKMASMAGGAAFLTACAPKATPAAEKPVETKPEEKEPVPAPTEAQVEEVQPTTAPAQQKEVTISFMGWGDTNEDEGVRTAIDEFKKEEPSITIKWMHTPDNYNEKLLALVAANTPPDTAFVAAGDYKTFCKESLLLDITDKVKMDPLLGKADYFIQPQEDQRCSWQGKWYGIGSCWVANQMYYNADIFAEEGIEPPSNDPEKAWTWDEFKQVATRLTKDKNGKNPSEAGFDANNIDRFGCDISSYRLNVASFVESNGGHYFDPKTGELMLDSKEAIEATQELADLRLKYHVAPFAANLESLGMDSSQMLENGKLAMLVDGSWALAWLHKIKPNLGTAVLPKFQKPATGMNAHLHCVLKGTSDAETSFKLVRFLATPFYQLLFLRMGLWLPSQTALMTPDGMKQWYTERMGSEEGVHPKGYDTLVTKYVPNNGFPFYEPPGWPDARAILYPEVDAIWNGDKTAEEAFTAIVPECIVLLQEAAK